jgi:hypothetical protein
MLYLMKNVWSKEWEDIEGGYFTQLQSLFGSSDGGWLKGESNARYWLLQIDRLKSCAKHVRWDLCFWRVR